MRTIAVKQKSQIARPLSVLVPMIQEEILEGNEAGLEHYRRAGELLIEVRDSGQVADFKWGKWLTDNFALSRRTAYEYMLVAERMADPSFVRSDAQTKQDILDPHKGPKLKARRAAFKLHKPVNRFTIEQQARAEETKLHRALALELIDIGFKALATRLHPDHGGPNHAMRRLNRVRRELNAVAKHRRFDA